MTNVINTQKHAKIVVITSGLSQKGLIYMSGTGTKETSFRAKTEERAESPVLKHFGADSHGLARHSIATQKKRVEEIHARQRRQHASAKPVETVAKTANPEASSPNGAEQNRTNNAKCIIRKSQQTILHTSDMLAARSELGTLNLDYAEADKKMLEQAKKLQKRFG